MYVFPLEPRFSVVAFHASSICTPRACDVAVPVSSRATVRRLGHLASSSNRPISCTWYPHVTHSCPPVDIVEKALRPPTPLDSPKPVVDNPVTLSNVAVPPFLAHYSPKNHQKNHRRRPWTLQNLLTPVHMSLRQCLPTARRFERVRHPASPYFPLFLMRLCLPLALTLHWLHRPNLVLWTA